MNNAKMLYSIMEDRKARFPTGPFSESCWELARACEGMPYVLGAWGKGCTPAYRRDRLKYNPQATTITTACQVLSGKKSTCTGCKWLPDGERVLCWDCRGFSRWTIEEITGFRLHGDTVGVQYGTASNWCAGGLVSDGIPQNVLVCLFIWNASKNKFTHTGIYFNGATMEASSNVQYFNPMKKNRWTHWKIAKVFEKEYQKMPDNAPNQPAEPPVDNSPGQQEQPGKQTLPTLRKGDKGDPVRYLQTLLQERGYDLGKYGVDGSYGAATQKAVKLFQRDWNLTQDGVCGPRTWSMLLSTPERLYTVTVSHLPGTTADEIIKKYGGVKVEE